MAFWFRVFVESPDVEVNPGPEDRYEPVLDHPSPRCFQLHAEIKNWLRRNSKMCPTAAAILKEYLDAQDEENRDESLPRTRHEAWNYTRSIMWSFEADYEETVKTWPTSDVEEPNQFAKDHAYGRVSRELDMWWEAARSPMPSDWNLSMFPIDYVPERIKECEANLMQRYAATDLAEDQHETVENSASDRHNPEWQGHAPQSTPHYAPEYDEYEEDADDDDSYGEGPMTGLLTEVPNILDPKQIEALHMIIKSCILDSAGSGEDQFGENLQQTRCRIFLATECGRNLLREMLVFIAVWEKDEHSLIFQISGHIIQAIHENSLIPYTWNALRSPKDIISPAQTVLLRLITSLSRTAFSPSENYQPVPDAKEVEEDAEKAISASDVRLSKMLNFLYGVFRSRIVPECVALMQIQGEVRKGRLDPADFPVDNWDLERAKDGLVQYLDFLYTIADIYALRQHLLDWEAVYELLKLLEGLDVGVEKLPFAGARRHHHHHHHHPEAPATPSTATSTPQAATSFSNQQQQQQQHPPPPPPPPPPPLSDPPHEFAWSGIKGQVLSILAALLQPPPGQSSPGNPAVQLQIVQHNGIVALLNCCLYDDNNRFCRERTQLCLKWLMDGSPDASAFLQNLVQANSSSSSASSQAGQQGQGTQPPVVSRPPPPPPPPPPAQAASGTQRQTAAGAAPGSSASAGAIQNLRVDGVSGEEEVRVQVRSASAPAGGGSSGGGEVVSIEADSGRATNANANRNIAALKQRASEQRTRSEELVQDLLALTVAGVGADEAAERLGLGMGLHVGGGGHDEDGEGVEFDDEDEEEDEGDGVVADDETEDEFI